MQLDKVTLEISLRKKAVNKVEKNLNPIEVVSIVFSSIVGMGLLSLPNDAVKASHQDGWIATAIGILYPLYIILIWRYTTKKFPQDTIITLSKKYFGKYFGGALNFIFLTYFIFFTTILGSYFTNIVRSFVVGFLSPIKVIGILFLLVIYTLWKDLKVLARVCKISLFIMMILVLSPMPAIKLAQRTNIFPIFDSSIKSLLKGGMQSAFAYAGAEIILILNPFIKEKKKVFKSLLLTLVIILAIYIWVVFITIFYLGPDIVTKSYWSFLLVTNSVTITIINNYRYVFIFLWCLIAFRSCSIYLYGALYIIKDFIGGKHINKVYFLIYPLLVYLTLNYGNEGTRQSIANYGIKGYVIFSLIYTTVILIVTVFKKGVTA